MIKILPYNAKQKEIWDNFVENSKNGLFMFKRDFMDYHADRFVDNSLMFYDDDELLALLPLSKHKAVLKSHGGLTFGGFIMGLNMKQSKMNACFKVLLEYIKTHKFKSLLYKKAPHIYYEIPADEDIYSLFANNAIISKVEVSTTINFKSIIKMSKGRKAQISRAKREGVVVEESNDFEAFIELENAVLAKHHNTKAVHSGAELALLKGRFSENIKLFVARQNGVLLAGCLLFVYKNLVHTQYMASDDKGREIGALDLIISTLLEKYKQEKQYFDFGISTENDGRFLNEGLIAQKEGFGGRSVCHTTWKMS